jgi:hypothetical protein
MTGRSFFWLGTGTSRKMADLIQFYVIEFEMTG